MVQQQAGPAVSPSLLMTSPQSVARAAQAQHPWAHGWAQAPLQVGLRGVEELAGFQERPLKPLGLTASSPCP